MPENDSPTATARLDVTRLPEPAAAAAEPFFRRVLEAAGGDVLSIAVVGSAASGDFKSGISDVNSVVVLENVELGLLEALAGLGRKFGRKGIQAPLLMTPEYIARSLDVFPLEFLDFKAAHVIVYGRDFFESLSFDKSHVRLACERELKSLLVKARRGYLSTFNKTARLLRLIFDMTNSLLPALRGLLFVADREAPVGRRALLEAAGNALDAPLGAVEAALDIREGDVRASFGELQETFKDLYDCVEALSVAADKE
ncbi:MAG: hypothetical protein ACYTAN_08365 [Planctomycetota bacterium]|jgi:hypothetical protein